MDKSSPDTLEALDLVSHSPRETRRLGQLLAPLLEPGDVLGLQGDLGAGKTQFVKGLARGLGVRESVHSPTFILANEHRTGRIPLFHVDAYRVLDAAEATGFGFEDYLDGRGVTVVEWAERIESALPVERFWVEFSYIGEQEREIRMRARGERYEKLLREFRRQLLL